ncbi:hypothetical protein FB451DRAFT_1464627 [Mycena latifolia]|nr:hypothetical protein FB451DRAFT_1464627 [Mycena latifolia]
MFHVKLSTLLVLTLGAIVMAGPVAERALPASVAGADTPKVDVDYLNTLWKKEVSEDVVDDLNTLWEKEVSEEAKFLWLADQLLCRELSCTPINPEPEFSVVDVVLIM